MNDIAKSLIILCCTWFPIGANCQSVEIMFGTERIFADVQFLEFMDDNHRVSIFSRCRATAEYKSDNTNLFSGAYLNYTSNNGLGTTVLGRISSKSSGVDIGLHYFKSAGNFMLYALSSINVNDDLFYSWFSILRYTPSLNNKIDLYSSLELYSAFIRDGHLSSVQRIRLGINIDGNQFGISSNLNQLRNQNSNGNHGIFLRKEF